MDVELDNCEAVILQDAFVSLHKELHELIFGNNSLARLVPDEVKQARQEKLTHLQSLAEKLGFDLHGETFLSFS
jgi:hypothetical protein